MGADIRDWFQAFYETSDDGTEHEKYTAFFSPDAMLIMGDKTAIGRNGMPQFYISCSSFVSPTCNI